MAMIVLYIWMLLLATGARIPESAKIAQWQGALSRSNYCPRWSPDGARIVFYSHIQDKWRIILMNADGSEWKVLSSGNHDDFYPSFSPDGKKILFYSNRDGNQEIYVMNLDGTAPKRLTEDPARDRYPQFSPDGKRITFVRLDEGGRGGVMIMDADGSGARSLTPESANVISRLGWSPDNSRIVFYQSNDGKDMSGENQWALYSVSVAEGSVVKMHDGLGRDSNVDWSASARLLVFDAHKAGSWESDDGGWEIFVSNPDGGKRRNVTNNKGINDWGASWSPDGKKIVYCSGMDDQYEIYVIDADGSNPARLTYNVKR